MFDKFKLVCIGATGIIFIASYFFVGVHYYRNGYETATKKYDEVLRQESEKNYQKIIETERNLTDKQNEIVSEYLKYIDDLEKQHEQDKIDIENLRDVNPNLNVIQKANYSERLKKVWILQTNVTD